MERNLLIEAAFSGVEDYPIRTLGLGPEGRARRSERRSGDLTTIVDGSTARLTESSPPASGCCQTDQLRVQDGFLIGGHGQAECDDFRNCLSLSRWWF